ncbi:MAG: hypothetical protein ABI761_19925 [Saprospiraceae bacterium]
MINDTAVILPMYKDRLTPLEERTVLNNIDKLNKNYKIFIIGPASILSYSYHTIINALEKKFFRMNFFQAWKDTINY